MKPALLSLLTGSLLLSAAMAGETGPSTGAVAKDVPFGHKDFYPSPQRPVGWRGDGTGISPGAKPPTQWNGPGPRDAASGRGKGAKVEVPLVWHGSEMKNVLWQVPMPHQSFASPIVVKGKVITESDANLNHLENYVVDKLEKIDGG